MNKYKNLVRGLIVTAGTLILAALVYFLVFAKKSNEGPPLDANGQQLSQQEMSEPGSSGHPNLTADSEIQFNRELIVQQKSLSIDGGEFFNVPCSTEQGKPLGIGFILLADGHKIEFTCLDDFMSGISLRYQGKNGEAFTQDLAAKVGESGEIWESRTWIGKPTEQQKLALRTLTLTSVEDVQTEALADCTFSDKFKIWDAELKDFVEMDPPTAFDLSKFTPPIMVHAGCLDEQGRWKGK